MLSKILSTLKGIRVGLALTVLAVGLAVGITAIFGPLFGIWDWPKVSVAFLVLLVIGIGALVEFARPTNPYQQTDPLYDLKDVAVEDELHSGGFGWLWNVLPLVIAAVGIFVLFV